MLKEMPQSKAKPTHSSFGSGHAGHDWLAAFLLNFAYQGSYFFPAI